MPTPKGDMTVVAVKAQKETRDKAIVWVEFISPPSHIGKQIQLYPKSLEPKNGPAKGADFSLLTAIKAKFPNARTCCDLGVANSAGSRATASALAALAAYSGGERFSADTLNHSSLDTSEQSPAHLHSLAGGGEGESPNAPPGYTRGMQDPKHRGQMLRSPIKDAWIAAEKLEMEGLARRKCWVRVLKSTLTAQDKVFSTRFHYKIKRKQGQFEKCKVRLVVQGQHMHRKDDQGRERRHKAKRRVGVVLAAYAGPRVPRGGVTRKRRCTYSLQSSIRLSINFSLSLSSSSSCAFLPPLLPRRREAGGDRFH